MPQSSHPSWVCGLKLLRHRQRDHGSQVTPFVGVWIETEVDYAVENNEDKSHPSWVCGLKQRWKTYYNSEEKSHPSWVCGLKQPG